MRFDPDMLFRTVGIEEFPADIDDFRAVPCHPKPIVVCHTGNGRCRKIFHVRKLQEGVHILGCYHNRHALLTFADCQFGTVQTLVFFRDCVKVDRQPVRKFSDGNRDAARAEIVALLDFAAGVRIAEQPLQFALLGSVSFLHFRAAGLEGLFGVGFGRAGCAAASVAPGRTAQKDDHISGGGNFAPHVAFGRCGNHRADFHPLGGVTGMINFIHDSRGKPDLVAVGGIACCGGGYDLPLRQFSFDGLFHRRQGVCRAADPHCAVDIGTSRKRVADRAADAGGSAAERFDLRRVVVGLVLEQEQPRLAHAVRFHLDFDCAGVDFIAFVQIGQFSFPFQRPDGDGGNVHQTDRSGSAELLPQFLVFFIGFLQERILKRDVVDNRQKRCVAAVIGPVSIRHAEFRNGRIAVLGAKIVLKERKVVRVHGKSVFPAERVQFRAVKAGKAVQRCHPLRNLVGNPERFGQFQRRLPRFHRVDNIFFDRADIRIRQIPGENVNLCRSDQRALGFGKNLNALRRRIRPLIELSRQIFHGKHRAAPRVKTVAHRVQLRFGKDGLFGGGKQLGGNVFRVIAVDDAHAAQCGDAEQGNGFPKECCRFLGKFRLFFDINPVNHLSSPFPSAPFCRCLFCNKRFQTKFFPPSDTRL